MTTPTEELAKKCGADAHYYSEELNCEGALVPSFVMSLKELQAFREAVEAESDAERMKQPAVARFQKSGDYYQHVTDDEEYIKTLDIDMSHTFPLYAQPFPSTEQKCEEEWLPDLGIKLDEVPTVNEVFEQLQQRVKELEDVLNSLEEYARGFSVSGVYLCDEVEGSRLLDKACKALANTQGDSK